MVDWGEGKGRQPPTPSLFSPLSTHWWSQDTPPQWAQQFNGGGFS